MDLCYIQLVVEELGKYLIVTKQQTNWNGLNKSPNHNDSSSSEL